MNGVNGTDGQDGSPGPEGPQGPAGAGVPTGGTAGQYLRKVGPGDYLTEWATPAAAEISLDITNCQIVTSTDLQGAVEELDGAVGSINASLTQLPIIQRGCKKNVSLSASSQTEVNITLDTPILTDYVVIADIVVWASANTLSKIVRDRGQSNFTLRVYNSNNVALPVEIDWIAIPV